eukprot:jgi/Tetstr1/447785/TSEL_035115.t1
MPTANSEATVRVESGRRLGMRYDLFEPARDTDRSGALLVLVHGFGCNRGYVRGHGERLAAAGAAVMTPNVYFMAAFSEDGKAMQDNIQRGVDQVADHARWLLKRASGNSGAPPAALYLAGHSAGGAVVLEAAALLASWGVRLAGVCLLDGVPWARTTRAAAAFPSPDTLLLAPHSKPSAWNKHGAMREVLAAVPGPRRPLRLSLPRSEHGDPMLPRPAAAWALRAVGLLGPPVCTEIYAGLLGALLRGGPEPEGIEARVRELIASHPGDLQMEEDPASSQAAAAGDGAAPRALSKACVQ